MSSSDRTGILRVTARAARIEVLDAFYRPVAAGAARDAVEARLPAGAYSVTAQRGTERTRCTVLVRPGETRAVELPGDEPSPADAGDTGATRLLEALTAPRRMARGRAAIVVLPLGEGIAPPVLLDTDGEHVETVPAGTEGAGPRADGPVYAGWRAEVRPGPYRLRWDAEDSVEQTVWVAPRLQTVVIVPRGGGGADVVATTMHFVPLDEPFDTDAAAAHVTERAITALWSGEAAARADAVGLLAEDAPLMAQLAAALLLVSAPGELDDALRPVVRDTATRLRSRLGALPDVLAVRAAIGQKVSTPTPALFAAAVDLLLAADERGETVIPADSLSERASGARFATRPWFLWKPLDEVEFRVERRMVSRPVRIVRRLVIGGAPIVKFIAGGAPTTLGITANTRASRFEESIRDRVVTLEAAYTREVRVPLPSAIAKDRVRAIVEDVAPHLGLTSPVAAEHLGATEIAARAGMPVPLVRRCLEALYG